MENNWIEKYWDLMQAEDFENSIPLKLLNFPRTFYKYRGLSERTIETLQTNYIWLAEISTLNDPFECSIQFDNDECLRLYYNDAKFQNYFYQLTGEILDQSEIKLLTTSEKPYIEYIKICKDKNIPISLSPSEQLIKVQERWGKIVEEANENLRICSFTLNNNSLLLWSHYADEHKGISIEYDFVDIDRIRAFIQPVNYRDKIHKIGVFEEYTTMQMVSASLIKSKEWEYEAEWRVTIFKEEKYFPHKIKVPNPTAIYLGTRFDLNDIDLKVKLFSIAKERNIPIYKMKKHPNEYKLIPKSINVDPDIT